MRYASPRSPSAPAHTAPIRRLLTLSMLAGIPSLAVLAGCTPDGAMAHASRIESLDQAIGGPKATARVGDYLLENNKVRFAVLDGRYSYGPAPYGGTLVDADLVRSDPKWGGGHGNDQMAETFSAVDLDLAAADTPEEVQILNDGSDGKAAIIRVDAADEPFLSALGLLWGIVHHPEMRLTTDYILEPDADVLLMRTTVTILDPDGDGSVVPMSELADAPVIAGSTEPVDIIGTATATGCAMGDFYLQGGTIDVFAPGIGFDEDGAVYRASQEGQNLFQEPFQFPFIGGTGTDVSYGLAAATGDLYVPLFTSSQTAGFGAFKEGDGTSERFPQGTAFSYERYLAVGAGDMGSVYDKLSAARGDLTGTVSGNVLEEGSYAPVTGAMVFAYEPGADYPWMQWEADVGEDTQLDGSFGGHLPPGEWELAAYIRGRPEGQRVAVTVAEGQDTTVALGIPPAGEVRVHVVDEAGRPMPGKVSFFGGTSLYPDRGDPFIGGDPTEVTFVPYGDATLNLPPGHYTAIATRGFEYEIDEIEFDLTATGAAEMTFQLVHSVDTQGWVSADFHVHSMPSFDSGVTLPDRVTSMVSEGVEYFSSSDHDSITDFAPTVEAMGMEPWLQTGIGLETTTLELGHYIGFPLAHDFEVEAGGAFDWTGMDPGEIMDTITEVGNNAGVDPVRLVAHPRDGILGYFDQYGFDPYTGETNTPILSTVNPLLKDPKNMRLDFDALELLNGKRFELIRTPTQPELDAYAADRTALRPYDMVERTPEEQEALINDDYRLGYGYEGQIDDWFTLINLNNRIPGLANSDTHDKYGIESGCPRNFVAASTDNPAELDDQAIADAVKAGHSFMSSGPFVRFYINDESTGIGDQLTDTDGTVRLFIEVQAPSWMKVDRVEVYENGTLLYADTSLEDGIVRYLEYKDVAVTKDSWFVVSVMGDDDMSPLFSAVEIPPIQLQDVVIEALSTVPAVSSLLDAAVPIPRSGAVFPYALTNPIYVDVDGDGEWTAPGIPAWMQEPQAPE